MTGARRLIRPTGRVFDRFVQEVTSGSLSTGPGDERAVTENDLADLPPAVQRYLRFMGVVGQPRLWSFRAHFVGRFRLRPRLGWMPAEAWQYNSVEAIGRVFVMRIRCAGVVPMVGVDSYLDGRGRMFGELLGFVTVADGSGSEFDVGELTTFLNDAVLLAPSFLLLPAVSWAEVDNSTFDVTLTDAGNTVTGRVFLDEQGAPVDFRSTDRYAALPGGMRRSEWGTPIAQWTSVDGRPWPTGLSAVWHLPEGDLPYVDGQFVSAGFAGNVRPGD